MPRTVYFLLHIFLISKVADSTACLGILCLYVTTSTGKRTLFKLSFLFFSLPICLLAFQLGSAEMSLSFSSEILHPIPVLLKWCWYTQPFFRGRSSKPYLAELFHTKFKVKKYTNSNFCTLNIYLWTRGDHQCVLLSVMFEQVQKEENIEISTFYA